MDRSFDSLKWKFFAMYRKRIPTLNSQIPDDFKHAKHIRHPITERADLSEAEEAEEDVEIYVFSTTHGTDIYLFSGVVTLH